MNKGYARICGICLFNTQEIQSPNIHGSTNVDIPRPQGPNGGVVITILMGE